MLPVLLALLAVLAAPAAATASPTQESMLMDDNRLLHRGNEVTDDTLRELRSLGVDRVRVTVLWRNFAPASRPQGFDPADPAAYPAEVFDNHDHLVRKARQFGLGVLFNLTGGAPDWATGRKIARDRAKQDGDVNPSPAQFEAFARMIGRRYDGTYRDENQTRGALPRVGHWSIWNEPNRGTLLAPQWRQARSSRNWEPVGPRLYRRLARAALAGLGASGHGDDTILLGETSPLGNPKPGNRSHIPPARFLRELFCLDKRLRPMRERLSRRRGCDYARRGLLRVAGYAHHPYSVLEPPGRPSRERDALRLADAPVLMAILDAAAAAGRIPAGLPVWYTEYGYETPPDPYRGIPLDRQAAWNAEAERMTRVEPRVAAHTHFLLRDDDPQRQYRPSDRRHWGTYQSGLRAADGSPKPALAAYRLPFVGVPGAAPSLWGLVRPLRGGDPAEALLQFRPDADATWTDVRTIAVDRPSRAFTADLAGAQPGEYRFLWPPPRPQPPRGPLDPPSKRAPEPFASEPVRLPVE